MYFAAHQLLKLVSLFNKKKEKWKLIESMNMVLEIKQEN